MRRSVLTLIMSLGLWQFAAHGTSVSEKDTLFASPVTEVSQRQFEADLINDFKADSDFKYEVPPDARPNLLQLIFQKFFEWLVKMLGNEVFAWLIIAVIVIIGVAAIGFAMYGIFGVGKTVPIYVREKNGLEYQVREEDIHEMDFSEEIDKAKEQRDYRKAIRLMYLFALKLLTDREIIAWAPHKTNHDYLLEIKPDVYREKLSTLGYFFEYAWYGHFQVEETHLQEMQHVFSGLEGQLKNG